METLRKISKFLIRIGVEKHIVSESKIMQQLKLKGKEGSLKQVTILIKILVVVEA